MAFGTAAPAASFLVLEAGLTLLAGTVAFCWPRACSAYFIALEAFFRRLARRRAIVVLAVGTAAIALRLALLPAVPIPQPYIHDEFSFLLAADTFASGRLTNPTHPEWRYFESFHITHQPTYMSMYFPGQGLALAGGQALTGDPWYGVLLSCGLMCAALCWMLQGWLPPGWALLGGMLAVLRLALFSNWINGYYGGAVAATGGALVLGALPRMTRMPRCANVRNGLLLALGAILLANSRPFEGILVCAPAAAFLLWPRRPRLPLLRMLAAPALLVLIAAGLMGYYNYRVFGDALTLPYQINRAQYASAPVFLWQSPRPAPEYRHKVMREFYATWEMHDFRLAQTWQGFFANTAKKAATAVLFFCGVALLIPLLAFPALLRDRRIRFPLAAAAAFAAGSCVNAWFFPHYAAPITAVVYALLLQCMRHLRCWKPGGMEIGRALVRSAVLVCVLLTGVRIFPTPLRLALPRWPAMWYGTDPLGLPRAQLARQLEALSGKQLAIVRYSPEHAPFDDWVYNRADIDASHVVWSREMDDASNQELVHYFQDRRAWLIEPDLTPPRMTPYP